MTEFVNLKEYMYKRMKIYSASFKSLSDMHMFLCSEPKVNSNIFLRQHSILNRPEFPGDTYENAVDCLIGGYDGDYSIALKLQKELENTFSVKSEVRRHERSIAGSHPNVPAYVAGEPKTMFRLKRMPEKKFVSIWFNLAYPIQTTKQAVTNRGALTLSLIKLLEENGIGVDLHVFTSCYSHGELFNSEIRLKSPSELINGKKCFYPMCSVMFLRRVVLRVMESMDFEDKDWYPNYGRPLQEREFREIFKVPKNDIVISSPSRMGVFGEDIAVDSKRFFMNIDLDSYVDLDRNKKL